MKTWNHRVIETQQDGQTNLTIHEVHYDEDGAPIGHAEATIVDGESIDDMEVLLASMNVALRLPILKAEVFDAPPLTAPAIVGLPVLDLMAA